MAEITKTWTFDADLEEFTVPNAGIVPPVWFASDGDPNPGCVRFQQAVATDYGINQLTLATTWEALGVPAGATVTHVAMTTQWAVENAGAGAQIKASIYNDTWSTNDLFVGDAASPATWATVPELPGEEVAADSQASDTPINVVYQFALADWTGDIRGDSLALTMTYTGGSEPEPEPEPTETDGYIRSPRATGAVRSVASSGTIQGVRSTGSIQS